ncbi:hypothetical protein [Streptomyces flaveus]|uniref:hypothetical protein n=1 Tax=Streptomyces flaveus TaxID=66370 RepID=UPI00331C6359
MSGFSSLPRARRRAIFGGVIAIVAVAGFGIYNVTSDDSIDSPLNVDFVLGGGTESTGKGNQLAVQGKFGGLAAAPDGTVYLFTQGEDGMVMWRTEKSGTTEQIPISGMDGVTAEQTAVASDGSVYLAADDLWKVSPEGKAAKVIDVCEGKEPTPLATTVSEFCTGQVTGVTVAKDGAVYIGDQVNWGRHGSYVHKVDGDTIELVAGRPPEDGESLKRSNPAVRNGINPPPGTKAKDVLVPEVTNSGWLSSDKQGLYWRTGFGIVRINHDGTLSPFVGAKSPNEISEPNVPFDNVGRALDAAIARNATSTEPRGDLAVLAGRDEVYYSEAGEEYSPPFTKAYRWGGSETASQKKLLENSVAGKLIYRVADGQLAPVIVGAQAITASDDALYVAAESNDGDKDNPENWNTAVVQVQLPKKN